MLSIFISDNIDTNKNSDENYYKTTMTSTGLGYEPRYLKSCSEPQNLD